MLLLMIWDFIQNQILGMQWLNELIGTLLDKIGLDVSGKLGGSIHFLERFLPEKRLQRF